MFTLRYFASRIFASRYFPEIGSGAALDHYLTVDLDTGRLVRRAPTQVSIGAPDAGKIPALDASGLLDASLLPAGSSAVDSVNGQTGVVVLDATDVGAYASSDVDTLLASYLLSSDFTWANISGKPTLGTAAALDVPASGDAATGEVVKGSDTRLSNSRAPSGAAGGVLAGTYPNPSFADDMATQAELDTHTADTTSVHGITDTSALYAAGGVDVALADGGTGASLADPNADRMMFWDDSAGQVAWLTPGTGLTISGTTIIAASTPAHAYYSQLCALLEPDALEPLRVGTGSVTIASGATKYLVLGWALQFGASSRLEIRDPRDPLPLRNVTISGIGSASTMILLDPTLATYADAWTTYHNRLLAIAQLDTKRIDVTAAQTFYPFLPGPYGCIITGNTVFNLAWIALRSTGGASSDLALNFELGDATTDWVRFGQQLKVPITKKHACGVESGNAGGIGSGNGSLTYVILPSTWSAITDPNSYIFRDDFMGATLDTTTTWTRVQSTTGNVEISTQFQWCKLIGDGTWGDNGLHSQATTSRVAGKIFLVDVFLGGNAANLVVGWHDGSGQSYSDFAHGVDFTQSGSNAIFVFENGTSRGAVGSGWTANNIYRVRITLGASSATYEIQGGPEYHAIGGATWDSITPGTSSSTTTPLAVGATIQQNILTYIGDMRLYT